MPDAEMTMALGRLTSRLADLEDRALHRLERVEKLVSAIRDHQLTEVERQKVEIIDALRTTD
jgi:hypothetical protein